MVVLDFLLDDNACPVDILRLLETVVLRVPVGVGRVIEKPTTVAVIDYCIQAISVRVIQQCVYAIAGDGDVTGAQTAAGDVAGLAREKSGVCRRRLSALSLPPPSRPEPC